MSHISGTLLALLLLGGFALTVGAYAQAPGSAPPSRAALSNALPPGADAPQVLAPPAVTAPEVGPNAKPFTLGDGPPLPARPFSITRNDPALDQIIDPNAKLELVSDEFGLTEGGVWIPEGHSGYLLVVDMLANCIYKITPDNKVELFMYKAGYSGSD